MTAETNPFDNICRYSIGVTLPTVVTSRHGRQQQRKRGGSVPERVQSGDPRRHHSERDLRSDGARGVLQAGGACADEGPAVRGV
jgi:hypothetical protein